MTTYKATPFYSIRIRHILFTAFVGRDGLRLEALHDRHRTPQWIPLGDVAKICSDGQGNWFVCKHNLLDRQIDLTDFNREDAVSLADALGITIQAFDANGDRILQITDSPAWAGLKTWAVDNPQIAVGWAYHDLQMTGDAQVAAPDTAIDPYSARKGHIVTDSERVGEIKEFRPASNSEELDVVFVTAALAGTNKLSTADWHLQRLAGDGVKLGLGDSTTHQNSDARSALADIVDSMTPDYSAAWLEKLDEADRGTILRAESALHGISDRLATSRSTLVGLLRELMKPDVWRVLMSSRYLKKVMRKVNPDFDLDRKERSVFALVLTEDGVEDIENVDIHETLDDLCDTLYQVASSAYSKRCGDFAAASGIDPEDAEQRRLAAVRWAAEAGAGEWRIRKTIFYENSSGTRGKEYSTILIDADLAAEMAAGWSVPAAVGPLPVR